MPSTRAVASAFWLTVGSRGHSLAPWGHPCEAIFLLFLSVFPHPPQATSPSAFEGQEGLFLGAGLGQAEGSP